MAHIELLARGVLTHDGYLLLAINKKKGHLYLPGGHIEFAEPARAALKREMEEELGLTVEVKEFLGSVEHRYEEKKRIHAEINLLFKIICQETDSTCAPESREGKIAFTWHPLGDLSSINFQPAILRSLLPEWVNAPGPARWASIYED